MVGTLRPPKPPQFCIHGPRHTRYLEPFSTPPFTMGIHFVRI